MSMKSNPGFTAVPAPARPHVPSRRKSEAGDWRRRVWLAWGILALVWFVGTTAYYGFGADRNSAISTRPAPLLSGVECNRVGDIDGQRSCLGVANLSRERRIMLQDREAGRSVEAGTAIVGPPLLSLLAVALFMHYVRPKAPEPIRPASRRVSSR